MNNPMVAVYRTLGDVSFVGWHIAADIEEALEPGSDD